MEARPHIDGATSVEVIKSICADGILEIGTILQLCGDPYSQRYISSKARPPIRGLSAHFNLAREGFMESYRQDRNRTPVNPGALVRETLGESALKPVTKRPVIETPFGSVEIGGHVVLAEDQLIHYDSVYTTVARLNRIRQIQLSGFGVGGFGELDYETSYWGLNNTDTEGIWTVIDTSTDILDQVQRGVVLTAPKYMSLLKTMHLCAAEIYFLNQI